MPNILVTQPATDWASNGVDIFVNGEKIGVIGPGESVMGKSDGPYEIKAECGLCWAKYSGDDDVKLNIVWPFNAPETRPMAIEPGK